VKAASWLSSLEPARAPHRLPRGRAAGVQRRGADLDHATFARECAIDIPATRPRRSARSRRSTTRFVMAQAKARHPTEDRFFQRRVRHHPRGGSPQALQVRPSSPSSTRSPHDVYDGRIAKYGRTLDAFWPVWHGDRAARHAWRRGLLPRRTRGVALNGRVVYRAPTRTPDGGERDVRVQSAGARTRQQPVHRGPNMGTYTLPRGDDAHRHLRRPLVRHDYKGASSAKQEYGRARRTSGRHPTSRRCATSRARPGDNWLKDVRTELTQLPTNSPSTRRTSPEARADEARRVPRQGHQAADQAHARPGHLTKPDALRCRVRPALIGQCAGGTGELPPAHARTVGVNL